jgi:polyhydroxyalkanoate synthase
MTRMEKPGRKPAKANATPVAGKPADLPAHAPPSETPNVTPNETPKIGSVQIEAFAQNLARLIEQSGKALAAYMKPREEGKIKSDLAEDVTDVVKTVGQVAEYWLSDPQRALELQANLGRAYLDLWAGAVKRMAGEQATPTAAPDPRDKR